MVQSQKRVPGSRRYKKKTTSDVRESPEISPSQKKKEGKKTEDFAQDGKGALQVRFWMDNGGLTYLSGSPSLL